MKGREFHFDALIFSNFWSNKVSMSFN
jgi:hypothetical protein